jgi:hypothetical protein
LSSLKKDLDIDDFMVIYPDSESVAPFFTLLVYDTLTIYYGVVLNDSIEFKKSIYLGEDSRCIGRIINEVVKYSRYNIARLDSSLLQGSRLAKMRFRLLLDDSEVTFNNGLKGKLLLVYHYGLGTFYDPYFKAFANLYRKHHEFFDMYIVTTDAYELKRMERLRTVELNSRGCNFQRVLVTNVASARDFLSDKIPHKPLVNQTGIAENRINRVGV